MIGLSRYRRLLLGATVAAALLAVGGCGKESYSDDPVAPAPAAASRPQQAQPAETEAAEPAEQRAPVRPEGSPPDAVLGAWLGGLGPRSDYDLRITAAGVYRLEHLKSTGIPAFVEQGYVVGDADELLLRPVQAQGVRAAERTVNWRRQPNSVIDMLVIHDPYLGELDFVRNDA